MRRITHRRATGLVMIPLAMAATSLAPSSAAALTLGAGAAVGTVTPSYPWSFLDATVFCVPQTLQVSQAGVVAVGGYAGPVTFTATATTDCGDPNFVVGVDNGPASISVSGSDGAGGTLACRADGSPAQHPRPIAGRWARTYLQLDVFGWGTCSIDGVDQPPGAFVESFGLLTPGAVSGTNIVSAVDAAVIQVD